MSSTKEELKEKIKRELKRFKDRKKRTEGDPEITGVTRPDSHKKKNPKKQNERQRKEAKHKQVMVGPRGGKYSQSETGSKIYHADGTDDRKIKKSLLEIIASSEKVENFIKSFKQKKPKEEAAANRKEERKAGVPSDETKTKVFKEIKENQS